MNVNDFIEQANDFISAGAPIILAVGSLIRDENAQALLQNISESIIEVGKHAAPIVAGLSAHSTKLHITALNEYRAAGLTDELAVALLIARINKVHAIAQTVRDAKPKTDGGITIPKKKEK